MVYTMCQSVMHGLANALPLFNECRITRFEPADLSYFFAVLPVGNLAAVAMEPEGVCLALGSQRPDGQDTHVGHHRKAGNRLDALRLARGIRAGATGAGGAQKGLPGHN